MSKFTNPWTWAAELIDSGFSVPDALRRVSRRQEISLTTYDPEPARASESNLHGGLLSLSTGDPLDSGNDIVVVKGTGKLMISVIAGGVPGSITITGTSVDRNTGTTTGSDTDTILVDALTTDGSDTDTNGNTRHSFDGAYISSKWFTGSVTLSTTDLTLTDVDVYSVSFEQFNDVDNYTITTFDIVLLTTNVAAQVDAYLYTLKVDSSKCSIVRIASLNVGADGETAIAGQYWRLRNGRLGIEMRGATDGIWVDASYSASSTWVEDATIKVWAEI